MNSKEVIKAYGLYQCGMSLAKVAPRFNTTSGRLWSKFKYMGLKLRTQKKNPHIVYEGVKYYRDRHGFYRPGSRKDRAFLHHKIWGEEVPDGFSLFFKDGNKENITKENLVLTRKEETLKYARYGKRKRKSIKKIEKPNQIKMRT